MHRRLVIVLIGVALAAAVFGGLRLVRSEKAGACRGTDPVAVARLLRGLPARPVTGAALETVRTVLPARTRAELPAVRAAELSVDGAPVRATTLTSDGPKVGDDALARLAALTPGRPRTVPFAGGRGRLATSRAGSAAVGTVDDCTAAVVASADGVATRRVAARLRAP